jgi:PAS domain S-box-containing protein
MRGEGLAGGNVPRRRHTDFGVAEVEDPLRLMVDAVVDYAIFMLDPQGIVTTWNSGASRIKGYAAKEIVGRHFSVFYPEEALARGLPAYELAIASATGRYEDEGWRVRKDGSRLWASVAITAMRSRDGRLVGYAKVMRDQTERRAAEETLRLANEEAMRMARETAAVYARLNSVLESTSDSVLMVGFDGTILYANRRALEGIPEAAIGTNFWECFPRFGEIPTGELLHTAMRERTEVRYEFFHAPYHAWFRGHAFPTPDGLTLFFSDITEEKNMQARLELERMLRERRIGALSHMAGGLAHEINNPLAIIHARASDLRALVEGDEPVSADEVRAATGSIVHTCDRAIRILRGLRGFAREAGSDPAEYASIYDIVENCLDLQESRFLRHRVELRVALDRNIPLLLCRETQIGQIVTNLLSNAFDAIDQSGSQERWVSLTAGTLAGHLWVDVMDSGPGIDDEFRAHLMDPFFSVKERGAGMGVGLSLSNAIAEDHGGTLVVAAETSHACFRLSLPFRSEAGHAGVEVAERGAL